MWKGKELIVHRSLMMCDVMVLFVDIRLECVLTGELVFGRETVDEVLQRNNTIELDVLFA